MKKRIKDFLGYLFVFLLSFIGGLLAFAAKWAVSSFGNISVDEIIFHLKVPLQGTDTGAVKAFAIQALIPALIITGVFLTMHVLAGRKEGILRRWRERDKKEVWLRMKKKTGEEKECLIVPVVFSKGAVLALASLCCLFGISYGARIIPVADYVKRALHDSSFIQENYADPLSTAVTFPEKKRNLIYIYLESMETSFMDEAHGGAVKVNYIPELTELAEENISFSSKSGDKFGGARMVTGTTWTMAGMFSQTSGLPLKLPVRNNEMSHYEKFFPGVTTLGEILEDAGYDNWLVLGSDITFGGRKAYFTQHGDYQYLDYITALKDGLIPQGYKKFWGFEDRKLFQFAKEKADELSHGGKPFNMTLLTVDTHMPNGSRCSLCEKQYPTKYENALSCSSRQVADFVKWLKKQDFYKNTTVIISGDHISMARGFTDTAIPAGYQRQTYNCIINPPVKPAKEENREFTNMDMFPTTLAALGCTIEGDRLGLGTNLFSERKTLLESVGIEKMDNELQAGSKFYDSHFMYGKKDK
ncbi:MAG: LTA synthase family protein [Eubacteriales bacterium]|nr:LTA synthase family protein [Eubacteriales bacterium]